MPILFAVFMYMGIVPMGELEFYQRITLMLMPKKHQPDLMYLRHVRLYRVHLFTIVQIICLILLFILLSYINQAISITFPLMVSYFKNLKFCQLLRISQYIFISTN